MPRLTFLEAKNKLAKVISSEGPTDPEVASALNFVLERFMKSGQWKGNKFTACFTPYDNQITAPAEVEAINALMAINPCGTKEPCTMQSDWYSFSENGRGVFPDNFYGDIAAIRQGDGFCSFREIGTPTTFIAYCSVPDDATLSLHVKALDENGDQIYTDGLEGFTLQLTNGSTLHASPTVSKVYEVIKPVTLGSVFLLNVTDNCIFANYSSQETVPNYQRYNLVGNTPETRQYLGLCTRAFIPLSADNDILCISNLNALRYGLQAYHYEDLQDQTKAEGAWNSAFKCLNDEMEIFESDATEITIKVQRNAFLSGIRNLV